VPVTDLTARFLQGLGDAATQPLGLAVSGGGDSMAMLQLAHRAGLALRVATVDHGLRAESAAEAAQVARVCAGLGVPHQTLRWQGWDGKGNLQDQARRARRALLADWARAHGLAVALAHTRDDVAETFLMRLARGAGVDGLSAMSARWTEAGVIWLRPLLAASREELRTALRGWGVDWAEDPSNAAERFDRVRARKALRALAPLGLGTATLADVAGHLAEARHVLEAATDAVAGRVLTVADGIVRIGEGFFSEPAELQRRLLQRVLLWIVPGDYAPRGTAVQGLLAKLDSGKSAQLAGCHFLIQQGGVLAFREAAAVRQLSCVANAVWDNRWTLTGPAVPRARLRALGADGLSQIADWRGLGLPRAALLSQPSVWLDDQLLAAPCARLVHAPSGNWRAISHPGPDALFQSVLSH
jgi:tRNA(Ile)-lysidine synthase